MLCLPKGQDKTMDQGSISFRELTEADLPLLHKWRNTPHVSKWWPPSERTPSPEDIRNDYMTCVTGEDPAACYVILCQGTPIGMLQSYKLSDYPAVEADYDLEEEAAGIDIFIGEEDYVYRGLGSTIIRKFLREIVFPRYDVDLGIIAPNSQNQAAIKAYGK